MVESIQRPKPSKTAVIYKCLHDYPHMNDQNQLLPQTPSSMLNCILSHFGAFQTPFGNRDSALEYLHGLKICWS